jgi:hypothetical protein
MKRRINHLENDEMRFSKEEKRFLTTHKNDYPNLYNLMVRRNNYEFSGDIDGGAKND